MYNVHLVGCFFLLPAQWCKVVRLCVCPRFYVLTSGLTTYSKLAFFCRTMLVMRLLGDHAVISKEGYRAAQ